MDFPDIRSDHYIPQILSTEGVLKGFRVSGPSLRFVFGQCLGDPTESEVVPISIR